MKRPSYKHAIAWLAHNDDCEWLKDEPSYASVCACLVADLFGKDTAAVTADLRRYINKAGS
jgi:hypothetical protein